jgi:hypothetical protein
MRAICDGCTGRAQADGAAAGDNDGEDASAEPGGALDTPATEREQP